MKIKNATKKGYLEAKEGDGIDISSRMQHHRGTVQKDKAQTLTCESDIGVVVKPHVIGGIGEKKVIVVLNIIFKTGYTKVMLRLLLLLMNHSNQIIK